MANFTDITGLAGVAVAVTAIATLLLRTLLRSSGVLRWADGKLWVVLSGILFVLMIIPFKGFPLAAYVRGVTGDLSILSIMLLGSALAKSCCNREVCAKDEILSLLVGISLISLCMYPMALGASVLDPYRWGYSNSMFVSALLLLSVAAWSKKRSLIAVSISLAVLAWASHWYESDNLWDYLLDPFLFFYALSATLKHLLKPKLKLIDKNPAQG